MEWMGLIQKLVLFVLREATLLCENQPEALLESPAAEVNTPELYGAHNSIEKAPSFRHSSVLSSAL